MAGELATSNTPSGSYRYDPEGLRVGMILGTGWRRYSWDDTSGVAELISDNRAGGETFSYVYGPDGMPCEQLDTNGGTTTEVWLHQDATGSVRLSTDSAGNQTSTQSYDPWGNVTATTGTPPQLGYDSEPVDPTGLIYLQARYYDPATGQFLTRDPAFAATLSAYGYTGNDPVNGSDPTGLICGKTFGSGTYNPACRHLQGATCRTAPAANAQHTAPSPSARTPTNSFPGQGRPPTTRVHRPSGGLANHRTMVNLVQIRPERVRRMAERCTHMVQTFGDCILSSNLVSWIHGGWFRIRAIRRQIISRSCAAAATTLHDQTGRYRVATCVRRRPDHGVGIDRQNGLVHGRARRRGFR